MQDKLYTVREASHVLGLKERTVRGMISDKRLDAIKYPGGKMWMISEQEIQRMIEGRKHVDKN